MTGSQIVKQQQLQKLKPVKQKSKTRQKPTFFYVIFCGLPLPLLLLFPFTINTPFSHLWPSLLSLGFLYLVVLQLYCRMNLEGTLCQVLAVLGWVQSVFQFSWVSVHLYLVRPTRGSSILMGLWTELEEKQKPDLHHSQIWYSYIAKCQYNCTGNVVWCQVLITHSCQYPVSATVNVCVCVCL